jgi:hypothetical protein
MMLNGGFDISIVRDNSGVAVTHEQSDIGLIA